MNISQAIELHSMQCIRALPPCVDITRHFGSNSAWGHLCTCITIQHIQVFQNFLELIAIEHFVFQRSAAGENGYIDPNLWVDISAPTLVQLVVTSHLVCLWGQWAIILQQKTKSEVKRNQVKVLLEECSFLLEGLSWSFWWHALLNSLLLQSVSSTCV